MYVTFCYGLMFTRFVSLNVRGAVVDHSLFRFSISQFIVEIFAKLFEIVPNLWTFLALPNFRGAGPLKVVPKLSCLPHGTSRGKLS